MPRRVARRGGNVERPIVVLKFGSSVLEGVAGLERAVDEIMRWRDDRCAVVAVVSALAGVTDSLLEMAGRVSSEAPGIDVAALLATGEDASAALLGLAVGAKGVPCAVARADVTRVRTRGPRFDADPVDVNTRWFASRMRRGEVVIVPGFVGRGPDGSPTVLGRGGSDLTAMFLADRLRAVSCRLVKDVDGLFEWDPADATRSCPRRYVVAGWAQARRCGASLVQPKAVRFAAARRLPFTIAAVGGTGTQVGPGPNAFAEPAPDPLAERSA